MKRYGFLFVIIAVILAAVAGGVAPALAQGGETWDPAICEGSEGVVFRTVDATTSDLPTTMGCTEDTELSWLIVEPWNRANNEMNPDRACLAMTWPEVVDATQQMSWTEGSIWRVSAELADNPLVVSCDDVQVKADLGLNPGEGQIELRSIRGTIMRAQELLAANGSSMSEYASEYPDHPITELFTLITLLGMGAS